MNKIQQVKTNSLQQAQSFKGEINLNKSLEQIKNAYRSLMPIETGAAKLYPENVTRILDDLSGIFKNNGEDLMNLVDKNHPNTEEILYVSTRFYRSQAEFGKALEASKKLADYYKKIGDNKFSEKFNKEVKDLKSLLDSK